MLNIEKHIFDLTMEDELSQIDQELKYGIDYDYIIESFYCEFKLDTKRLNEIKERYTNTSNESIRNKLIEEFDALYPEHPNQDIAQITIPDTITKKAYFVQSPKGKDGLPSIHYSLKEKMLSDFRAMRTKVKKQKAHAAEIGDKISEIRYNAKQLAIKVVCNSEYGAANNEHFAHYDPDVAAAVTYASRKLIAFLTNSLESSRLYVDNKFIEENKSQIALLRDIGCIDIQSYNNPSGKEHLFRNRRHTLRRIFDDSYNVINDSVLVMNIKPSTVCYQDTDSNYYRNDYIIDKYVKHFDRYCCDPGAINDCMHAMLAHNQLMANFARDTIKRRPYALDFEGGFIICRYLNRKKKYYGIKWGDDAELKLGTELDPNAYVMDDVYGKVLITDYSKYWMPKKTVLPQPNGEYIYLDTSKLLNNNTNYLDYAQSQNVKCTGIDLARRDQYKFINYFHMYVLQKDLRLMKYIGNNEWSMFSKDEPMKNIIDDVVSTFHSIIKQYNDIANLKSDNKPIINFKFIDFSKNAAYRYGKLNAVSTIVTRLKSEEKHKYIPNVGERMSYVIVLDERTKYERSIGKPAMGNIAERSYTIQEKIDELHVTYPESETMSKINEKQLNLTYEDFIEANAISSLDIKYYFECLCKAMALYIVGDHNPKVIKDIDDGVYDAKQANTIISNLQTEIAKEYVNMYYRSSREIRSEVSKRNKSIANFMKSKSMNVNDIDFLRSIYGESIPADGVIDVSTKNKIMSDVVSKLREINTYLDTLNEALTIVNTRTKGDTSGIDYLLDNEDAKHCNMIKSIYTNIIMNENNSINAINEINNSITELNKKRYAFGKVLSIIQ